MAAMLQRGLAEDGYTVDVTMDGLEAVWQATEVDYDVIVLGVANTAGGVRDCHWVVSMWADHHRASRLTVAPVPPVAIWPGRRPG
jgi:hypothetical protein